MKKKVSFLLFILLSWITVSWAQTPDLPVKFSSVDGIDTYWYYISFNRRSTLAWYCDNSVSGEVQQKAFMAGEYKQQWKLVGTQDNFYFVNRATGYMMAYTPSPMTDSNGNSVPISTADGNVYYTDEAITVETAAMIRMEWSQVLNAWTFLNNGLSGNPYMNDRAGRNVCNYGYSDPGDPVSFFPADLPVVNVSTKSLSREGLVDNDLIMPILAVTSMNRQSNITGAISGDDASAFTFGAGGGIVTKDNDTINIIFHPTEVRAYNATLTLSTNGIDDILIALSGTAFGSSSLPVISSDGPENENWYYVQFVRKAPANVVWSLSDTTRMIVQDTLKGGVERLDQQWKICGDWTQGYYIVNRESKAEVLYNTKESVIAGEETRIFTDVASADSYVLPPAGEFGNNFEFATYKGGNTWQLINRSVSKYNAPTQVYVNDQQGKTVCNYSVNDAGNELQFVPANVATIFASATPRTIKAPLGEIGYDTLKVAGVINSTADISVSITGDTEGVFSIDPAVIPATGGLVAITFTPPDNAKQYVAYLTLKSPGAKDIVITVTGVPIVSTPSISTDGNESWYYLQFNRRPTLVWQGNGINSYISQVAMVVDNQSQQWKFTGTDDVNGYLIENRTGGQMYYDKDPDGDISGNAYLVTEGGDSIVFVVADNGTQLQTLKDYNEEGVDYGWINDLQGNQITEYYQNDAGNFMTFIPAESVTFSYTGIAKPDVSIDSNDNLISTKYYTLQGIQVVRPSATGIYIVRKLYASGKTQATKILFQVNK